MRAEKQPVFDWFRLVAVCLVVAIHTAPLADVSPLADLWFTRILARIAVPFFLMTTGYFLSKTDWSRSGHQIKKLCRLYGISILLYLPVNLYAGRFGSAAEWMKQLLVEGTFYHLWYFPAVILGIWLVARLQRFGLRVALPAAVLLYLIGLGGDSYYGLLSQIPTLKHLYDGLFSLSQYTRNGLFYVPLFLVLGSVDWKLSRWAAGIGLAVSMAVMSGEGLWLHAIEAPRHDSMYLMLPVCMVCLFTLLRSGNHGSCKPLRRICTGMYVLHPLCILLLRGGAKVLGLEALLIENNLLHFLGVLLLSGLLSGAGLCAVGHRPKCTARAWREIDPDALGHNVEVLRQALAPDTELMAVVKADAYGHGAVPVARQLQRRGVRAFAVACLTEGIALRKAGIRGTILILGYTAPEEVPLLNRWRLTQTVVDGAHGHALAAQGRRIHVHLALDTGMHRLGIPTEDWRTLRGLFRRPELCIDGVFSHLCVSDGRTEEEAAYTEAQLERFYATVERLRSDGYDPGKVHIQASYGIWNLPVQPCDYARAGIALYGVGSDHTPVRTELDLRPVLSVRARVASVRTLQAGDSAGYGRAYRAQQTMRMAVVTIGYADGLPRSLAQRGGTVLIRGRRCPMIGRMCMDQLLVDVNTVPEVAPGDVVTLLGQDGAETIGAEDVALCCDTITNELLSRMGARLPVVERTEETCG